MFQSITAYLEQTPLAVEIAQSSWLFPGLESIHVLALAIVFGSISMVDLRLLNIALRHRDIGELSDEILPWTWMAFCVAVVTGSLLFLSAATKYLHLWAFELKMVLMALAGINMLIFHFGANRTLSQWRYNASPPLTARLAGGISLTLWIGIISCGRWIGFL